MSSALLVLAMGCSDGSQALRPDAPGQDAGIDSGTGGAYRKTLRVSYNGTDVDVVVDKPINDEVDVLVVYHGSVWFDNKIMESTNSVLDAFKRVLTRKDMMIVSVGYPEQDMLIGDNIAQAEAGLLWVQNTASSALGITVKKVFLGGHSQGGYIVTRLNGMHLTDGVVANGAGPLDLVYRCGLEDSGALPSGVYCAAMRRAYGTTTANPQGYAARSLLNFTQGFKAPTLFVQGENDTDIQMHSWPTFKNQVTACSGCAPSTFLDLPGVGHAALFESASAATAFNAFLASH